MLVVRLYLGIGALAPWCVRILVDWCRISVEWVYWCNGAMVYWCIGACLYCCFEVMVHLCIGVLVHVRLGVLVYW